MQSRPFIATVSPHGRVPHTFVAKGTRRNPSGIFDPAEREAFIARFKDAAARGEATPGV